MKRIPWLQVSSLQNFARRYFLDVNEVSIVFPWEINIKTGKIIWKGLYDGPEGPLFSSNISPEVFWKSDIVLGSVKQS